MSLLMDALRQVEQAKKQAAGPMTSPAVPEEVAAAPSQVSGTGNDDLAAAGAAKNGQQGLSLVLADESAASPVAEVEVAEVVEETPPVFSEPALDVEPETVLAPASAASVKSSGAAAPAAGAAQSVADAQERRPPVFSSEGSRQAARTVFAAKKEYQRRVRNRRLLVLGITAGLVLSGVAGFSYFVYRSTMSPDNSLTVAGDHSGALRAGTEGRSAPVMDGVSALPAPSYGQGGPEGATGPEVQGALQNPVAIAPPAPAPAPAPTPQAVPPISGAPASTSPLSESSRPVAALLPLAPDGDAAIPKSPLTNPSLGNPSGLESPGQGQPNEPYSMVGEREGALIQTPDMAREPVQAAPAPIVIKRRTARPQASSLVVAAYDAYQKGDYTKARTNYQQVLLSDPKNRSALLALAAIALQGKEVALARDLYLRLLDQDPADPLAWAGLLAIAPSGDPAQQESELKLLLKQYPKNAPLLFSLGNLYAARQRWSEAQQAYFNALQAAREDAAVSHAPSPTREPSSSLVHPDYPFNLAVSLEHLGKVKPAINFYREALQCAAGRPAGFDPEALRVRLQALEQGKTP